MELIQVLFSETWNFLSSINVPILDMSFATLYISIFAFSLVALIINYLFVMPSIRGGYRSGKGGKADVSEERKGDQK